MDALYIMNTGEMVRTDWPELGELDIEVEGVAYLRCGKTYRAVAGLDLEVGRLIETINDTGNGYRSMPDHQVIGRWVRDTVETNEGTLDFGVSFEGEMPPAHLTRLPMWVCK